MCNLAFPPIEGAKPLGTGSRENAVGARPPCRTCVHSRLYESLSCPTTAPKRTRFLLGSALSPPSSAATITSGASNDTTLRRTRRDRFRQSERGARLLSLSTANSTTRITKTKDRLEAKGRFLVPNRPYVRFERPLREYADQGFQSDPRQNHLTTHRQQWLAILVITGRAEKRLNVLEFGRSWHPSEACRRQLRSPQRPC